MGTLGGIASIIKTEHCFLIEYKTGELAQLHILNSHVFKYYMSPTGVFLDYPVPNNPDDKSKINIKKVSDYDVKPFEYAVLETTEQCYNVYTNKITIRFDRKHGTMAVRDLRTNKDVLKEPAPLCYANNKVKQTLNQYDDEYFFGGGMQNGRFSHKGNEIHIVNSNNWVDGGVTSPCPFYWSTYGYAVLRNTWLPGLYDFGARHAAVVETIHQGDDFDAFFFINSHPKEILKDYYELTGQPIFMPEYAFYEAHLNAFNRDYWVKVTFDTPGAILFEDGCFYKCYQPKDMRDKEGILESLNGEKNNYQFSARAMIDRYNRHDMPLGWFVPNDGYGCGYGQTSSLDGDIENLRQFGEYARKQNVEVALWTESNLEPVDPKHPKKGDRDLAKEVGVAGVVALKCDVAWIGSGYSFGLSAVENASQLFSKSAKGKSRLMIIMVDGWAGTQRYAGIWSGDQTGGEWEYIRFHIPTYIGSGLSGMPIVGSDMDGIYGGGNKEVNIRDFQWKTFTPLQLNMDGWGKVQKTPFSYDAEAQTINRAYLKLKSMFMPYNYTIGYESIHGLPMVRALFLEFPQEKSAFTNDSQYQFLWGPHILVAPVYKEQNDKIDCVRNGIYLPNPDQVWIDMFTGVKYQGGKIWNNLTTPLWKIPVFIKNGAIIPMTKPNNNPNEIERDLRMFNIYPDGESSFELYEDDGISSDYLEGHHAQTKITVIAPKINKQGDLFIHVHKAVGAYKTMIQYKTTILRIMISKPISHIKATINDVPLIIPKCDSEKELAAAESAFYFQNDYMINPYLEELAGDALRQKFLVIKIHKINVTSQEIHLKIKGYENKGDVLGSNTFLNTALHVPTGLTVRDEDVTPSSITLRWDFVKGVYYEIERDGTIFTNIVNTDFTVEDLEYDSEHKFRIRSANSQGVSKWSYYIVVSTKEDPHKYAVKDVKVTCNIPCQPCQEVCKLTDGDATSLWHTHWAKPGQADPQKSRIIKLSFDLRTAFPIDRVEYTPRKDAGNGTILQVQYRYSQDGKVWSPLSGKTNWDHDETVKIINLHGIKMRFFELSILDTIGGFGSGKHILFYKTMI